MANFVYTNFKVKCSKGSYNLSTDALKLALFTGTYVPNQDTDTTYAGIAGEVAAGNGYATGGVALGSVTVVSDTANHRMKLTASNAVWNVTGVVTFRYAVLYDSTVGDLVALYDPGANQSSGTSGTLTVSFDATNGVLDLT